MRTALVVTNRRCNQNCTFCTERSAVDERALIHQRAIETNIDAALRSGAEELVITGGEPTLRRDLAALVAHAKQRGTKRIVLETNGANLDARALRGAGVDVFRVHVPAWGDALDAFTRTEGAFAALERALAAIVEAEGALEIATPIVRSNATEVAGLPARIVEAVSEPSRVRVMYLRVPTRAPDERELLTLEEAARAIAAVDSAARGVGLATKLADDSGPPPCVFPRRDRPAHLWSLTGRPSARGDRVRVPACDGCFVREQCPGFDAAQLARSVAPSFEPVTEERARRRLSLIKTVDEQIAREFLTLDRARHPDGHVVAEAIVRVNFHCNQACGFCFVSTHLPPPRHDAVVAAIEDALGSGAKVVLSGGEPTLNPRLAEYVALASRRGTVPLQLQTNAIRLDDDHLVRALVDAGLREAFVSLHAGRAEPSDAVTGAPGTFARTVVGIDNLVAAGVHVTTNFVISEPNAAEFPRYVALVAERWPTTAINVSFIAPSTDVVPRELVPRYSAILPYLTDGLLLAQQHGLSVRGFESMCGMPLCLVPAEVQSLFALPAVEETEGRGEFMQTAACAQCSARARCYGIRRGYAELHGVDELRPLP